MKKFYSFLLLTMLLLTSNLASALTLTLKWETAGSVEITAGNIEYWAEPQDVSGKTEYVYTFDTYDNVYVAVSPGSGYSLVKAIQNEDNSVVVEPNAAGKIIFNGNGFSATLTDKTYTIYCEKVALNDEFNVNVVNGLDYFKATFATGSTLNLEKGTHSYSFNSATDGDLTITPQGIPTLYSVTLDGNTVYKQTNNTYKVPVKNGSNLLIQAFENPAADAPETCKLTFEYGPNMEGCIMNVRNWTTSSFVDIVDNTLDVRGYTDLQLNFVEKDYTVTKIYLDGKDITSELVTSAFDKSQKLRFVVPNTTAATIRIEGNAKVWGNIDFTGYIMGAEGVEFSTTYQGSPITMPQGQTFNGSYSVGGYTLTSDNAKCYTIPVSEKIGKIFFRPKAGYYIAELYTTLGSKTEQHGGSASIFPESDGTTFYMVVKKLEAAYSFDVTTTGSTYYGRISTSNPVTECWDNPAGVNTGLTAGTTQTVSFYPGYSLPLVIAVSGPDGKTPSAYLDGAPLTGALNSDSNTTDFTFTPYYPTAGDGMAEGAKSDVQVYLSTAKPSMSGVSLELVGNAQAKMYYSQFRHEADAEQALISDTQVIVKPASKDLIVKYKGQTVELDENGEYIFNVIGNARNNIVTVSPAPQYTAIISVDPATGSTVKKINEIKVVVPVINEELTLYTDEAKIKAVTLTDGTTTYSPAEISEPQAKYNDTYETIGMEYPLLFTTAVTTAGNYTLTIPEGTFYEAAWDETAKAYTEVAGGYITNEYKATYTIDPSALSPIEDYTVSPVNGSELETIDYIYITFNRFKLMDAWQGFDYPETVTMTCGELEQECMLTVNDEFEGNGLQFVVVPIDEDWMDKQITTPGVWTLVTNDITYKGEAAEIHLTYTVTGKTAAYTITPESGSTVDNLSEITITFPEATTVEYNELPVTIKGADYEASSTDVHGSGNSWTVSFRNPTYDDEYTVTFPAGAFTIDGEESKEATATYTFESAYVLTPESGSTLDNIEIAISFPHATNVEFVGGMSSISFTNYSSYATPSMNCVKDASAPVPTFIITIPEGAQKPAIGNYDLIIEEGAFEIDGKANAAIFANYDVEHAVSTFFNQDPDGTIVYSDWGINFTLIFDESANVTAPAASAIEVTLAGETVPAAALQYLPEGNMLMFMIYDETGALYKEGKLILKIAEGSFKIGNMANPAIEAKWDVVAPKTFTGEISPSENDAANEVGPIEVAYINFPDATKGEIFNEYGINLHNTSYSYFETGTIEKVETARTMADGTEAKGVTFAVKFPKATKSGTYILSVREGTFTLDGAFASPELESTYYVNATLTGINAILANGCDKVTVVTVDGKVLYNNADVEVVNDLEAGFYIINGQKLFITK